MGYDLQRFQGEVDKELTCPICSGVLEEPLQAAMCEHAFCKVCINEWLSRKISCPVDRNFLTKANLRPVPRILRIFLSRLSITCDNAAYGCKLVLKLDALNSHLKECKHNPKRPVTCRRGCGFVIPKDELRNHNCVRELRTLVNTQQKKLKELTMNNLDAKLKNEFWPNYNKLDKTEKPFAYLGFLASLSQIEMDTLLEHEKKTKTKQKK